MGRGIIKLSMLCCMDAEIPSGRQIKDFSHDAPTSYIAAPIYEKRVAIHNALYSLSLKGLKPNAEILSSPLCFPLSTTGNR